MNKEVPTSIGLTIILITGFFAIEAISADPSDAFQLRIGEIFTKSSVATVTPQRSDETAIVQAIMRNVATLPAIATSDVPTKYGKLPHIRFSSLKLKSIAPTAATSKTLTAAAPIKTVATSLSTTVTASSLLDATTISFREQLDGPYHLVLATKAGTGTTITWGLDETTIGGTGSIPSFSVAYSCDPLPNLPLPGASDQNPTFNVRASYDCTISLTPTTGNDRRTQSKQFSFTTPAGQLIITPPHAMSTVLQPSKDDGGFVFKNNDTNPITVTGLTLDVSYTALNLSTGPLVLRFINPSNDASFGDYHLEDLAANPTIPYTHTGTGITIPLSLAIGPTQEKLLPLRLLGVNVMRISGIDPTVTITLRDITMNQSDAGTKILSRALLSWSCIVSFEQYDPNATSGPYATGQACR